MLEIKDYIRDRVDDQIIGMIKNHKQHKNITSAYKL